MHAVSTPARLRGRRPAIVIGTGVALAMMLASRSPASPVAKHAPCLPLMCKFSVSGKKGRYLEKQMTPELLAKADAATAAGLTDGRSLDSVSVNKGANAGTGLLMPKTEAALMEILARIRAAWPHRAPPPISVRIVGTTAYSPLAKPDNVIVVPLGLLMHAESDDEVAWVMAHEFSHIALAHFSREAKQRRLKGSLDQVVDCARLGMALSETRARTVGGQTQLYQQEDAKMRAISAQVWSRSSLVYDILEVYNQRLSRKQEDQADAAGLDLVIRAKYSDAGYGTALTFLQAEEKLKATLLDEFGSQFGNYAQRAGADAMQTMLKGGSAEQGLNGLFKGLFNNAKNLIFKKAFEAATSSHRPAAKRKEGLGKYMDGAWRDETPPEPTRTWLEQVRATDEYKEAEIAANARDAARQAILVPPGDPADPLHQARLVAASRLALEKIRPAIRTRYASTPLIANTVAYLNRVAGNYAEADRLYDLADRSPHAAPAAAPAPAARRPASRRGGRGTRAAAAPAPAAPPAPMPADQYLQQSLDGFSEHVDLLLSRKNYAKAKAVIDLARSRFKDDDGFLPALITIYSQTNKKEELLEVIKRCAATQDVKLRDACDMAFFDEAQMAKFEMLSPEDQDRFTRAMSLTAANSRTGSTCLAPAKKKEEEEEED